MAGVPNHLTLPAVLNQKYINFTPPPYFDKFTLRSVFWNFSRSLREIRPRLPRLGTPYLWHLPGLSDDASAGVSHPDAGPEVDGVPLVVGQAVLDHDVEMLLQLKRKIQSRSVKWNCYIYKPLKQFHLIH